MKKAIITFILVVATLVVGFLVLSYRDRESSTTAPTDVDPVGDDVFTETIPVLEGFPLWTDPVSGDELPQDGNPLGSVDPYSLGSVYGEEEKVVSVVSAEESKGFIIEYHDIDGSVTILLTEGPFREKRIFAEQEFLSRFGITKAAACRLDVRLSVFAYYDMTDYGLSFCPDGIPFSYE